MGLGLPQTASLVRTILEGQSLEQSLVCNSSGSSRKSTCEVVQHAAAFIFLKQQVVVEKKPFTPDIVLAVHKILMDGMVREDGKPVNAGLYRDNLANAGFHVFLPPQCVQPTLVHLLANYNARAASATEDPFTLAAWLSYEFVSIHPFEDGNGRMSRLLLNMVLLSYGVPFCSVSSGHRQAKKQYLQCIQNTQRHGGLPKRLAFVVLCSILSSLASFFDALHISANEEYPKDLAMLLLE